MGVSLICELDDTIEGPTVGYNVLADFTLSALGGGDLDMPAMNQQEGTLTTFDKRVVPMHVALPYGGYVLNDIANALGLKAAYTIDYTKELPQSKGFKGIEFDRLPDSFDLVGNENRGYLLQSTEIKTDEMLEEVLDIEEFDGAVVYCCNAAEQFSPFTAKCDLLDNKTALWGSQQFAMVAKLQEGDRISFTIDGVCFSRMFKIDTSMKGTIALNPTFDMGLSSALLSSYRFSRLEFERVGRS